MTEATQLLPTEDINEYIQNWANLRLAHEGLMVDRVQRMQRAAEKMADMAATGVVGPISEDDDMAVSIGNKYFIGGATEAAPVVPPTTPTAPTDPVRPDVVQAQVVKPDVVKPDVVQPVFAPVGNGGSKILPMIALMLGTLGAGGIGAGALALWNMYRPSSTVVHQSGNPQDLIFGINVSDRP